MDARSARILSEMNTRFYAQRASDFSATRRNSWPGWERCLSAMEKGLSKRGSTLSVMDVACGNMRFEQWLNEKLPDTHLDISAVDNCRALLPDDMPSFVEFDERDIVNALLEGCNALPIGPCDMAVSFGFMHHIPGMPARATFLEQLLESVYPGGFVVVSFWCFADDPGLLEKAQKSTAHFLSDTAESPCLDEGDYLLDFSDGKESCRYCHSFSTEDIDGIMHGAKTPFTVVDRFRADGRTAALNEYLVLRRSPSKSLANKNW